MKEVRMEDVVKQPYQEDAILRDDFPGFYEDYLILHSLIRQYEPITFMEIGTSYGVGTKVICNAMNGRKVYSIDLPPGTDPNVIYPGHEDGIPDEAGISCDLPYVQLYGNSNELDFSLYYPIDGWFIDGKHSYSFVAKDTEAALQSNPRIILWHDSDIPGVFDAIHDTMQKNNNYHLFRVTGTRMAFALLSR